jgi:hypothetical protein
MQHVAQLLEPPDLMGRIQGAAILREELLVPPGGQQAQDLRGIVVGTVERLGSHAVRLPPARRDEPLSTDPVCARIADHRAGKPWICAHTTS